MRSVRAEASARAGGLARNDGELGSMLLGDLRLASVSVDQDISMSVGAASRIGGRPHGVSAPRMPPSRRGPADMVSTFTNTASI